MDARLNRSEVRIVWSREAKGATQRFQPVVDERDRDNRPGRFAVQGSFIQLPREPDVGEDSPKTI